MDKIIMIGSMILMLILIFGAELRNYITAKVIIAIAGALLLGGAGVIIFGGFGTFNGELAFIVGITLGAMLGYFGALTFLLRKLFSLIWTAFKKIPWWGKILVVLLIAVIIIIIIMS